MSDDREWTRADWPALYQLSDGERQTILALMTPPQPVEHYVDARARVLIGDAVAATLMLDDASVDAIITDPPYCSGGISEASRTRAIGQGLRSENLRRFGWFTGDNMGTAGLAFLLRVLAFESVRVVKPSGSLIVFADWRMLSTVQPAIESAGLRFQNLLIWNKGSMGMGSGFRLQHECALHFTYGDPEYHTADVANIGTYARVPSDERVHQAQKPVGLLREYVRVVCPPGGVVLDWFAGSSTTGVAALVEGRRYIAVDRDLEHAETSAQRLRAVQYIPSSEDDQGELLSSSPT